MNAIVRLKTSRLELRSFVPGDAEHLFDLDRDPRVMQYIGANSLDNVEAYRQRIESVYAPYAGRPDGLGLWAVWEAATGQFAGWCCVRPAADYRFAGEAGFQTADAELGYRMRYAVWGRGFATEASSALIGDAIARGFAGDIVATALAANRSSIRVMEKCGLSFEREFQLPGFDQPSVSYRRMRDRLDDVRKP